MEKINVLIPMAGEGSRFSKEGFRLPKPFIPIDGKPMIELVLENLNSLEVPLSVICVIRTEHDNDFNIKEHLEALDSRVQVVYATELTEGAACTCLLAKDLIDNSTPLLIANSDQYVEWDSQAFYEAALSTSRDGTILCFHRDMELNDTKWSYASVDAEGHVLDVQEKKVISENATVGIYFWNRGSDYVRCAEEMIERDVRVNGEFYVAPTYTIGVEAGLKFKLHECSKMWGLGTPSDLQLFELNYLAKPRVSVLALVYRYIAAFNRRSLGDIADLLAPDFVLTDSSGVHVSKNACTQYISSLFAAPTTDFMLDVGHIHVDGNVTVIEFETLIGGRTVLGVDVIKWSADPVMKSMHAYTCPIEKTCRA